MHTEEVIEVRDLCYNTWVITHLFKRKFFKHYRYY